MQINHTEDMDNDVIRKDAIHHELSTTDSSLKDFLIDDSSGSLFDSISWLLMNSGSLDFSEPPDDTVFANMKASFDALESSISPPASSGDLGDPDSWQPWSPGDSMIDDFLGSSASFDDNDLDLDDDDDDLEEEESAGGNTKTGDKRKRGTKATKSANNSSEPKKKRQRERVEDLEAQLKSLMNQNSELRSHLMDLSTRAIELERQKADMMRDMAEKVLQGDTGSPTLITTLQRYGELFAEYGEARQKEVAFHLSQLNQLLLPTQTTKMCLWTLQQDKTFYESSQSPLWNILSKDLGLSPEQAAKIQSHRRNILRLSETLQESLKLTKTMQAAIARKHDVFAKCLGSMRSIFSPSQQVLFLLWVRKYGSILAQLMGSSAKQTPASTAAATTATITTTGTAESKPLQAMSSSCAAAACGTDATTTTSAGVVGRK